MPLIPQSPLPRSFIPSPVTTQLPHLSAAEQTSLPYPPGIYPGARDVSTSYGPMRVYEWGPETGRKIMMVHGDATCAPLWKTVATQLVARGCRVMVIDLWGRGYTSSPLVPHDGRLLALQILFAASSSPLPWCSETFSIIGFSLGGGTAMDFTTSFPHLVRNVAFLGSAGMIRELPKSYIDLRQAAHDGESEEKLRPRLKLALGIEDKVEEAAKQEPDADKGLDVDALVRWQYEKHEGHVASFISTLQYGPVQGQHETWKKGCDILKEKQLTQGGKERFIVICGDQDTVVPADHFREDLDSMIEREYYVFETVKGGHGFLMDEEACNKIVACVAAEWGI